METEQTLKDHLEGVEQRAKARLFLSQEIPTRNPDCTSDYSKHYNHDYKQGVVHAAVLSAQTSSVPTAHATHSPCVSTHRRAGEEDGAEGPPVTEEVWHQLDARRDGRKMKSPEAFSPTYCVRSRHAHSPVLRSPPVHQVVLRELWLAERSLSDRCITILSLRGLSHGAAPGRSCLWGVLGRHTRGHARAGGRSRRRARPARIHTPDGQRDEGMRRRSEHLSSVRRLRCALVFLE